MPRAKKLIIFQAVGIAGRHPWPTATYKKTAKIYRADFEQIEKNDFWPFRNVKPMADSRALCTRLVQLPYMAPPAHGRCSAGHQGHESPFDSNWPMASNAMPKIGLMLKPMGLKNVHVPRAKKLIIF